MIQKTLLHRIFVSSLLLLPSFLFAAPTETAEWKWFTDKPRDFKSLLADPRETESRIAFLGNGKSYMDFAFGGHLGLVRKETTEDAIAIMGRGLMNGRFQMFSGSFDHQNSDFVGGVSASYKRGLNAYEFLIFHQSSHLGDEVMLKGQKQRINFSYESIRLLYSRNFTPAIRAYAGFGFIMRADPEKLRGNVTPIFGADWHFLSSNPAFFTAFDIRFKQENYYAPNFSWVAGYELGDLETIIHRQRFFVQVYNGYSNQGQFYQDREFYYSVGFAFTM